MRVVNVEFLLHIANFFKYHITHKDEGILNYDFELLSHDKKPKAWQKSLEQGLSKPGSKWMGSYGKFCQQSPERGIAYRLLNDDHLLPFQHISTTRQIWF